MTTTAVRDTLCNLRPMEIPRPKCAGFQFVPTRGRMGFYMSIKRDGEKYGIQLKNQGPRRPSLPDPKLWGSQPPVPPNNNTIQQSSPPKSGASPLNSSEVGSQQSVHQPPTFLTTAQDLVSLKAAQKLLSTVIIPEELEELTEPEPDYYNSESTTNTASQVIAVTSKNAPAAPPLPPHLLLSLRRSSVCSQLAPLAPLKPATKRQVVSKKKCRYEYLIEEEEGQPEQVLKF